MRRNDFMICSGCNRDLNISFPWGAGADSIISCEICGWCSEDSEPRTRIKEMSLGEVAEHVDNLNDLRKEIFGILYPANRRFSPTRSQLEHLLSRLDKIVEECREEDTND